MPSLRQPLRPMFKTVLACAGIEVLLFLVLLLITRSALAAIICSVALFGSASLLFGPSILRRLR
jgi:hypothetical protein